MKKQQAHKLKKLAIVEGADEFLVYKEWSSGKRGKDPVLIAETVQELVDGYVELCKKFEHKPTKKTEQEILELVNKHNNNKTETNHEQSIFKSFS